MGVSSGVIDSGASRRGILAATASAVFAALAAGLSAPVALAIGLPGVIALGTGLAAGYRGAVDAGSLLVFASVVAGAALAPGSPIVPTALATVGTIVAWDVGHRSLDLGEQLGVDAGTSRLEGVHFAVSAFIGLGVAVAVVLSYTLASSGLSVAAVVLLLLSGAFFAIALGTRQGLMDTVGDGL